jgi:hypothetical protein
VQFDGPDGERLLNAGASRAVLLVDTFDRDFCTDMKALLG